MALPALRHADFRNYIVGTLISNTGTSTQSAAIMWHIYHLTGSPLAVGLLGVIRVGPLVFFTLYGGVLADQADRRKIMLITQSAMAIVALLAFLITVTGNATVVFLYLVVALKTVARAFDGPARQSMFVTLVPARDFPNAASIHGISWRVSDILGPLIFGLVLMLNGGFINRGLSICYALNFLSFFAVIFAVWVLPACLPSSTSEKARSISEVFGKIVEGWTFVARTPVVCSAMWIDFWATFFSGADALIPAVAQTILKVGPFGFGLLMSASGIGALIAATALSLLPTIHRQGRTVVMMIGLYGFFTILFGLSNNLWIAAVCLACVGASDMISTVLRQTIRQLATPDELRGRMNATSSLFHISGPQLGDFEAGFVAQMWSVRASILLGGGLCMFVAAHWSRARQLVGYVHSENQAETVIS